MFSFIEIKKKKMVQKSKLIKPLNIAQNTIQAYSRRMHLYKIYAI